MGAIVPMGAAAAPAEDVDAKLDRVLAKLDRIERVIGALVEQLPMRWRVAIKAVWHG